MINRRLFIKTLAVAAATPTHSAFASRAHGFGRLVADRKRIIDLPEGFEYRVIARMGDEMSDGLLVPGYADGMSAFAGNDGRINLVCNHELGPSQMHVGPFGSDYGRIDRIQSTKLFDDGNGKTPGNGGTTTIVYNPDTGQKEQQFLSLAGTEFNCAGGPTPWGSWLSCEESFGDTGPAWEVGAMFGMAVVRSQPHGYVFEVPSRAQGLVEPVPLKEMGRFEHEAAAVDPRSGVVYLTEDRHRSLFYRYLPNVPGKLHEGGQLQALALSNREALDSRNWSGDSFVATDEWMNVHWIDLEDVDNNSNDLRLRGYAAGAARFARGEGLCYADGSVFITCTIGGPDRLGQVFEYRVSSHEGTDQETTSPGKLRLLAEADHESILRNADNLTMSPWGDLIVCEDTADHCGLVGIKAEGSMYALADNAYTNSELAGVCFSPDGKTMFVNIQDQGITLAINGPW